MLISTDTRLHDLKGSFSTDFIFEVGDVKCGKITIQKDRNTAWIWNVQVHEKVRGMGLSNKLMEDAMEYIRIALPECSRVLLKVHFDNEKAQKAYIRAGFGFLNEVKNDLYTMECLL